MEVVPSRSYKLDVRPYPISVEEQAMSYLRETRAYYLAYRLMVKGGLIAPHALHVVKIIYSQRASRDPKRET